MFIRYKIQILTLLAFLFITSCAGPNTQICHPGKSRSCLGYTEIWGQSLIKVVAANFPDDLGFYKPIVHKANFLNAWVKFFFGSRMSSSTPMILTSQIAAKVCS